LLVTSTVPGEGKTFVTSNLAQSIVRQPDRRVLIIDADLRCARLHTHLGAPSSPGLTDYLRGEVDEMAVIQQGQDGNLFLIAGGVEVTNPSELLLNGRLKKLIDRVAPVFDWVIVDSPP
jgi:tyrosine-protein kinase Etk/Wzc